MLTNRFSSVSFDGFNEGFKIVSARNHQVTAPLASRAFAYPPRFQRDDSVFVPESPSPAALRETAQLRALWEAFTPALRLLRPFRAFRQRLAKFAGQGEQG